jgi:glycosyltransferase involved in cell wall biosynthesis
MARPVRVLMLVENNAYPFDVRVRRETLALHDAGYELTVIAPRGKNQSWSEDINGVHVARFPAPPGGNGLLGYAFEFFYATAAMLVLTLWVAITRGIDVIHVANPPDTLFVIPALLKPFGVKFVFDHHDLSPETYLSRFNRPTENSVSKVFRFLERCSFYFSDIVISTNNSYRELAISRGAKKPGAVFVVRNGPPKTFAPVEPNEELLKRATHLVGYIGTMGPQDGVDYWLRSIKEMVFTLGMKDILAVIIGDGDAAPALRRLAAELKIEPYVWFTGRISDKEVLEFLSSVSVCVQPDPFNPLNDRSTMNKVMEYMALGKPLVAFDLTETRFSAGDAALFAVPNDELDFAKKVAFLLQNPTEAKRLGEAGQRRVRESLAWEFSVPRLLEAYSVGLKLPAS